MNKLKSVFKGVQGLMPNIKRKSTIPIIHISGTITNTTTMSVLQKLSKVSSNSKAIAILINTSGGSIAQTHIIITNLKLRAKSLQIPVYTFGQEECVNTGLMLMAAGDRVFIDETTVVGGTTIGLSKGRFGFLDQIATKHTFTSANTHYLQNQLSPLSDLSQSKTQEVTAIEKEFHDNMVSEICQLRKGNIKDTKVLSSLSIGEEAVKLGLADEIGTFHKVLNRVYPHAELNHLNESEWMESLRRFKALSVQMIKQ